MSDIKIKAKISRLKAELEIARLQVTRSGKALDHTMANLQKAISLAEEELLNCQLNSIFGE